MGIRSLVLIALIASCCRARAAEVPGQAVIYRLAQVYEDGFSYFVPGWHAGVGITLEDTPNREVHVVSNVAVFARRARSTRTPSGREMSNGEVRVLPGSEVWLDRKGFIHSVLVLERQLDFDRFILKHCGGEPFAQACVLTRGRPEALAIEPPPITGILDLRTLEIPWLRLEVAYDAAYRRFETECKDTGLACSEALWPTSHLAEWAESLRAARATLDAFRREIHATRLGDPVPDRATPGSVFKGKPYGGLEGLPAPGLPEEPRNTLRNLQSWDRVFGFPLRDDAPESQVFRAADPLAFDAALFKRFAAMEKSAEQSINAANAIGALEEY